jgi:hypothetical protein
MKITLPIIIYPHLSLNEKSMHVGSIIDQQPSLEEIPMLRPSDISLDVRSDSLANKPQFNDLTG